MQEEDVLLTAEGLRVLSFAPTPVTWKFQFANAGVLFG
jgi:hypothetical protein